MASIKITENRKGELVGRIHISTKDLDSGKNKVVAKRFYNEKKLTYPKFEKYLEKKAIELEEKAREMYENHLDSFKTHTLTFEELGNEFIANIKKNLSINYYIKAKDVVIRFNNYLKSIHLDKEPISEIKVRDVQLFLNNFRSYRIRPKGTVKMRIDFPKTVNLRLLEREGIINRCCSYNLRHNKTNIDKEKAIRICEFCNLDFDKYFKEVPSEQEYSAETVKGYRRVLRTIFNEAIRYEWITRNPVCQTKISVGNNNSCLRPVNEKEVFSIKETQDFIKALDEMNDDFINKKTILKFMVLTGVRIAEMCGLKWSDIDFTNKIVHIRRSRQQCTELGNYEKEPKTRTSIRDIPLTDSLIEDLKAYYKWFQLADDEFEYKLDEYYLTVNVYREPLYNNTISRWLRSFEKQNHFKLVSCHGLRHTYCSLLLSQNVPIQTVSKYMGHSDSTITLKVYSHFIPDTKERVINALNNIV